MTIFSDIASSVLRCILPEMGKEVCTIDSGSEEKNLAASWFR